MSSRYNPKQNQSVTPGGLTYCTNIHPGEAWPDIIANLDAHVPRVKQACSPDAPFPLGLRISHRAATEIGDEEIALFHNWCAQQDCYLLTINGFPYGDFHEREVKENVYQPDWRSQERVVYTKRLVDLAIAMMTQPTELSISTVPIAFKNNFDLNDWPLVRNNLIDVLTYVAQVHVNSGIIVRLALEPEPGCVLETMDEVTAFFDEMAFPSELRDYIGICFDACHQAVEFEDPATCLARLAQAEVAIVKVQVSNALRAVGDELPNLSRFCEPVYLHQAIALAQSGKGPELTRFNDLPQFMDYIEAGNNPNECRVHFHVPVFVDHLGDCGTTRFFLEDFIPRLHPHIPLEVETYSFNVLPAHLRRDSIGASIERELQWVKTLLQRSDKL